MPDEDLQSFRVDALMFGGMGMGAMAPPASAPAPAGAAAAGKRDAGYPTIEGICAKKSSFEAFSANVAKTVKELESKAAQGNADARKCLKAYDHMSELVGKAVELTIAEIKKARSSPRWQGRTRASCGGAA
jgi:hypothetical protein